MNDATPTIAKPTHEAAFPLEVVWLGTLEEDRFRVSDILDHGLSERELTGRAPALTVPVADIQAQGGVIRVVQGESNPPYSASHG